jgi:hypothetical protein
MLIHVDLGQLSIAINISKETASLDSPVSLPSMVAQVSEG